MPVAIGRSAEDNPNRLEVDGGIGFAITSWSQNQDLALDYIKTAGFAEGGGQS